MPYFLVSKEGLPLDGSTPTLLYGCRRPRGPPLAARAQRALLLDRYGGFEISLTPGYSGGVGAAWLEKGHAYVQANIRGGGEFGPPWHQAALKEKLAVTLLGDVLDGMGASVQASDARLALATAT